MKNYISTWVCNLVFFILPFSDLFSSFYSVVKYLNFPLNRVPLKHKGEFFLGFRVLTNTSSPAKAPPPPHPHRAHVTCSCGPDTSKPVILKQGVLCLWRPMKSFQGFADTWIVSRESSFPHLIQTLFCSPPQNKT